MQKHFVCRKNFRHPERRFCILPKCVPPKAICISQKVFWIPKKLCPPRKAAASRSVVSTQKTLCISPKVAPTFDRSLLFEVHTDSAIRGKPRITFFEIHQCNSAVTSVLWFTRGSDMQNTHTSSQWIPEPLHMLSVVATMTAPHNIITAQLKHMICLQYALTGSKKKGRIGFPISLPDCVQCYSTAHIGHERALSFGLFTVRRYRMHSRMTKFAHLFVFGVHHTEVRPSGPALLCKSTPPRNVLFHQCLLPSLSPVRRSSCCLLHSVEPFHVHMEFGGGLEGNIDHVSNATCAMCRTVCRACSITCRSESGQLVSFIVVIGNERLLLCRGQPFPLLVLVLTELTWRPAFPLPRISTIATSATTNPLLSGPAPHRSSLYACWTGLPRAKSQVQLRTCVNIWSFSARRAAHESCRTWQTKDHLRRDPSVQQRRHMSSLSLYVSIFLLLETVLRFTRGPDMNNTPVRS